MVMVRLLGDATELLSEIETQEKPLQLLVRDHPDLLPIDEFGMQGPLLVVGREISLASGSVDLVAVARSGELLVVEFKTGPQNPDFRAVLAQLMDYGSDLWEMTLAAFEQAVAVRFFNSASRAHGGRQRVDLAPAGGASPDGPHVSGGGEVMAVDIELLKRIGVAKRMLDALGDLASAGVACDAEVRDLCRYLRKGESAARLEAIATLEQSTKRARAWASRGDRNDE